MIKGFKKIEIVAQASEVLGDTWTSLPVKPMAIAESRDIIVKPWKPVKPGISGFLMKQGDVFGIGYSEAIQNRGFQNFTVAHELGHYFLSGHVEAVLSSGVHYSASGFVSADRFEKEADCFAAELLMPERLFKAAMRTVGSGFRAIAAIAERGETSIVATAIRFAELADDPVAVIVSSGSSIEFAVMSAALKARRGMEWLKRGMPVPSGSATSTMNRNAKAITGGDRQESSGCLDDWFEGAPNVEIQEDVVGLGHYGKVLTVLFTEEPLNEDEEEDEDGDYPVLPSMRRGR